MLVILLQKGSGENEGFQGEGKWPFPPPVLAFLLSPAFHLQSSLTARAQEGMQLPGLQRPTSPAQKPKLGTPVDSVWELPLITWS